LQSLDSDLRLTSFVALALKTKTPITSQTERGAGGAPEPRFAVDNE